MAYPLKISVEDLSKRFNREWIFRGLTCTFESGSVYAITGANGSGKSTLLQILWGQMPPTSGNITYSAGDQLVPIDEIYRNIAIATPYMDLIDEFTLEEQLRFHFKLKQPREGLSVDSMLDRMYLRPARKKFIANFSSGMKQRLKLGLAFMTQADVIFLDEPGTNLDKQAFNWYQEQLKNMPPECLLIIASNQQEEFPASALKIDIMDYKRGYK